MTHFLHVTLNLIPKMLGFFAAVVLAAVVFHLVMKALTRWLSEPEETTPPMLPFRCVDCGRPLTHAQEPAVCWPCIKRMGNAGRFSDGKM